MTHARTIIRKRVVELLRKNISRVYESKVYPVDKLPAIIVYTPQEQVTEYSTSYPRTQIRQLTLLIEIYANIDPEPDRLSLAVEEILGVEHTLGGLAKDIALNSTEISFSAEGDKPLSISTLTYYITYSVKENSPNKLI